LLRTRGCWNPWRRGASYLAGRGETTDCSSRWSWRGSLRFTLQFFYFFMWV